MGNREPLDMSQFGDDYEGDFQAEIGEPTPKRETANVNLKLGIPSQANPKFKDTPDHALDDKIKKFRNHSHLLKDTAKMEKYILDLEREKLFRDREKRKEKGKLNQGAKANEDDYEGDFQVEIGEPTPKRETANVNLKLGIPSQANPKFKDTPDHALEDKIKKFRNHSHLLKDTTKMEKYILDLEREKLFRDREKRKEKGKLDQGAKAAEKGFSTNGDNGRPMSTRASCGNVNDIYAQSEFHAADSPPQSEELVIVNRSKWKGHSRQRSPNTEGSSLDGGKDASRAFSGDLAGPSLRLRLRSSSKKWKECNELAGRCCCRFYRTLFAVYTEAQSPRRNSAPRAASGRIGNGIKRAREGVGGGDSPSSRKTRSVSMDKLKK